MLDEMWHNLKRLRTTTLEHYIYLKMFLGVQNTVLSFKSEPQTIQENYFLHENDSTFENLRNICRREGYQSR